MIDSLTGDNGNFRDVETTRRRGRLPYAPRAGERMSLGLKVTPEIKNQLDSAAKANGRTQSQEAEARIEQSFRNESFLEQAMDLAYGRRGAVLLAAIGRALREVGRRGDLDMDWLDDASMFNDLVGAIDEIIETVRPTDVPVPETRPLIGLAIGRMVMHAIKEPAQSPWQRWGAPLNDKLGNAAGKLNVADVVGVSNENIEPITRWRLRR